MTDESMFRHSRRPSHLQIFDPIMKKLTTLALFASFVLAPMAHAQEWADLTVQFVLDGDVPELKEPVTSADAFCAKQKIPSERLVVNKDNKGIANMVFMIDAKLTKLPAEKIHPSMRDVPAAHPVLDNVNCMFVPHVFHVRAGQTIDVKNSDQTGHNAKFVFFNNDEWNQVIPIGGTKSLTVKKAESGPSKVECNIHPWMSAYHVVTDHPYVGISDSNGMVKIEKLPAGMELTFKMWHEAQNKFDEVSVNGKSESWKKGNVKLTLKAGANELGKVSLKPDKFKP